MEPPVMPPVYPVDPFPPPTLPVPVDLENEIANKLANKLRAAGSDYSGSDYGWFDTLLSVGKKVLPKVGDIVDEVARSWIYLPCPQLARVSQKWRVWCENCKLMEQHPPSLIFQCNEAKYQ